MPVAAPRMPQRCGNGTGSRRRRQRGEANRAGKGTLRYNAAASDPPVDGAWEAGEAEGQEQEMRLGHLPVRRLRPRVGWLAQTHVGVIAWSRKEYEAGGGVE
jgi:hypothetical protein